MSVDDLKDLDEETLQDIEALKRITLEKNGQEAFAAAQFHIGITLAKNGKREDAILILSEIKRKDNLEAYAKSQFNIGKLLYENNDIEGALEVWCGIKIEDGSDVYAEALFEIGKCVLSRGKLEIEDLDRSIGVWSKIKRYYSIETYTNAQYATIIFLALKGDLEAALTILENITHSDSPTNFARAHYFLGIVEFR